jgi:N utilization substance protein B
MAQGTRRRAREAALKILFQIDLAGTSVEEAISAYWECFDLEAEGDEYAGVLVRGISDHLDEIDASIRDASSRWRLERMARVDRNALRIGTYELTHCPDVPTRVILDEAIELGKRFGSEESGSFVNGLLDRLAQSIRPADFDNKVDSTPSTGETT